MPGEVPIALNLAFYALLIWGLSSVLSAFRVLVESDRLGVLVRILLFTWLGVPAVLAISGQFAQFDLAPPPLLRVVATMALLVVVFVLSPWGRKTAQRLPASLLVGSQGFRFPLEFVLYGLAARQIIPDEITFAGYNFDVVTGVLALVLWFYVRRARAPRWLLLAWNALGLMLLLAIVTMAILSLPEPFGWFEPANKIVAYYPWVLLPTFLVQLALLSHLLLFRKLLGAPPPEPTFNT